MRRTAVASGTWGLPTGAIEPGEDPRRAVEREVREETGYSGQVTELLDALGGPRVPTRTGIERIYGGGLLAIRKSVFRTVTLLVAHSRRSLGRYYVAPS